jgi:hypothetical protein
MAYACGECQPQYKITEVFDKKYQFLKGTDIDIDFKKFKLDSIEKQTSDCAICYDYYLTGNLRYNRFSKTYLIQVQEGYYKLRFQNCCK